jgi:hypothetical protein
MLRHFKYTLKILIIGRLLVGRVDISYVPQDKHRPEINSSLDMGPLPLASYLLIGSLSEIIFGQFMMTSQFIKRTDFPPASWACPRLLTEASGAWSGGTGGSPRLFTTFP